MVDLSPELANFIDSSAVEGQGFSEGVLVLADGREIPVRLIGSSPLSDAFKSLSRFEKFEFSVPISPDQMAQLRKFFEEMLAAEALDTIPAPKILDQQARAPEKPYWRRFERKRRPQ